MSSTRQARCSPRPNRLPVRSTLIRLLGMAAGLTVLASAACERQPRDAATTQPAAAGEVVAYVALDRQFSEPILAAFTRETGITVRAVYDAESTKTVGLVNRILAERDRPRCDVFWNNEIVNTLRLQGEGLLQPCQPAGAEEYPPEFRDPEGHWFGFAARARVLLVNNEHVPEGERPTSLRDLADPRWRGKVGIAKPLFGTTASHVACLFAALGEEQAAGLLASWRANDIVVLGGNKSAAEAVGAGRLAFVMTDTDDAIAEIEAGRPVTMIMPDQGDGGPDGAPLGTLLLPNTLGLIRGGPNAAAGLRLIEYLLRPEVEAELARSASAQIPLHPRAGVVSRAGDPARLRIMRVDFTSAAAAFSRAARHVEQHFLSP